MRVDLNPSYVSRIFLFFTVVLLSQYIRCNDEATVSARMSLVCLAHRLYHCTVSSVFVLTLFEQNKNDDDDDGTGWWRMMMERTTLQRGTCPR